MTFWSDLGEIAGKALVAFGEIKLIADWEAIEDLRRIAE